MSMGNFFRSTERFIRALSRFLNILGIISLLCMMMLTVSDVFLRYFFKKPIIGGTELTQCFMVCMVLGLGWTTLKGQGIKMDLLVERFSIQTQRMIDSITAILGVLIMVPITITFFFEIPIAKELGLTTAMLRIPEYPFYFVMGTGFGTFTIVLIILLIKNISNMVTYER